MARKRTSNGEGGINLDSLMDALTNVVAVLILVLILVQADVSQKVQKFLDDLKPATPEEVVASKAKVEDLLMKEKLAEARLKEEPPSPAQIEEEKRQLALLEKSLEENKDLLADLSKVQELEKKVRIERDGESKQTKVIQDEIAKLEALLDQTPVIKPDAPTVVNIPKSRPIPADAKIYYAMVLRNRVHIIDPFTPLDMFAAEFKYKKNEWLDKRITQKGADRYIYNGPAIAAYFKTFDWKNSRGQKIEVVANPTATRLQLVITPDLAKGGTAEEELGKKGSGYANTLYALSRNFKAVLMFRVHPDSFNTYLEARALADNANVAAGWEINGADKYNTVIPDVEIKRLQEPPPPPTTPQKPRPPTIKPKLD